MLIYAILSLMSLGHISADVDHHYLRYRELGATDDLFYYYNEYETYGLDEAYSDEQGDYYLLGDDQPKDEYFYNYLLLWFK